MEVCMNLACNGAPLFLKLNLLIIVCELLEGACRKLLGSIIIGVGDVCDGYALGAVLLADPVGVREINADRS